MSGGLTRRVVIASGVLEHMAEFQKIADNSNDPVYPGTRAAGTTGYDQSVEHGDHW